jgi:DNA repair exonuclease SbcCD ATPase subunit
MILFKTVRWKNFLSTGNVWTEIDLKRSPNTLIIGENGAGKSTVLDALCFGLFGKPFRSINKPQLINSVNLKDTVVEVEFLVGSIEYKVFRSMKPYKFEIYVNDNLVDQTASVRDYQDYLESNILKLNYTSFTQIVILGSSTFIPFMQLPSHQRREIIEELLDIKIFTIMNTILKEKISENKVSLNDCKYELELHEEKLKLHLKYIEDIKTQNDERLNQIKIEIQKSEFSISQLNEAINEKDKSVVSLQNKIKDKDAVKTKLDEITKLESKFESKIRKFKKEIDFYKNNDNCPTCLQVLSEDLKNDNIENSKTKISEIEDAMSQLETELTKNNERLLDIYEINEEISTLLEDITDNNNQVSSINRYIQKLNQDIEAERSDNVNLKDENEKIRKIKESMKTQEKMREEYTNDKAVLDVASELLKDKGIKTQIIKQYVPVMNKLINKYLASMEFFVNFELNENFEETIKSRHRDEFSYSSFSEGEKARLNIALLLTWRAVAKMKNSVHTNLLILDEVFDSSLDEVGVESLTKIFHEFNDGTNLFIISHRGDVLQDKFRSVIKFEKVKNFSRIAA